MKRRKGAQRDDPLLHDSPFARGRTASWTCIYTSQLVHSPESSAAAAQIKTKTEGKFSFFVVVHGVEKEAQIERKSNSLFA